MTGIFSFIKHPLLHLLHAADKIIPGIEKVIVVYYNNINGQVECKGRLNVENAGVEDYLVTSKELIKDLRSQKLTYKWLSPENLPFETTELKKRPLNLFDELNYLVLSIGFKSDFDNHTDLIYIYLNPKQSNFGIPGNQGLTTNEKSMVGSLLYNTINFNVNQQKQDVETLRMISSKVNDYKEENKALKEELDQFKSTFQANMVELCQQHIQKLSNYFGIDVVLSDDAIEKIETFNGNMDSLKTELERVASVAINLSLGTLNQVVIRSWDIQFTDLDKRSTKDEVVQGRYAKTLELLDKLENAAKYVLNSNKKLTSENVGNACPQPITAPAISDSLKNHQRKVLSLMQNYPERWSTIRNEFRPIKNILNEVNAG